MNKFSLIVATEINTFYDLVMPLMYIQKILKWKSHTHTCTSEFCLQVFHVPNFSYVTNAQVILECVSCVL